MNKTTYRKDSKATGVLNYRLGSKDISYPLQHRYGSHLPLLLDVLSQCNIKSVLEIGLGECSTPILASLGTIEIVEQGEVSTFSPAFVEWGQKEFPHAKIHIALGKDSWRELPLADHYDLVFIDGYEYSRVDIANWAADHADVIILHDTEPEAVCYGWDRLNIPWYRYDYTDFIPNATVFSRKPLNL
ncbi:MAG: hypothetical protein WC238_04815 [Parcubacteria group bacterium]|jgi:hypothetical protein